MACEEPGVINVDVNALFESRAERIKEGCVDPIITGVFPRNIGLLINPGEISHLDVVECSRVEFNKSVSSGLRIDSGGSISQQQTETQKIIAEDPVTFFGVRTHGYANIHLCILNDAPQLETTPLEGGGSDENISGSAIIFQCIDNVVDDFVNR